jgi:hypothetical protein
VDRLSRERIIEAFDVLANRLPAEGGPTELVIVGGAALVLLYGARDSTKDIDALAIDTRDSKSVFDAAHAVADSLGLPTDWLNDGAKGYMHGLSLGDVVFDSPRLIVRTAAPAQLLAMKLSAWRDDVDIADAALLLSKLNGDRDEVWGQVTGHLLPGRELKARYAFEDLWEASHGTD